MATTDVLDNGSGQAAAGELVSVNAEYKDLAYYIV